MNAIARNVSGWNTLVLLMAVTVLSACEKPKAPEQLVFADPNQPMAALAYIAEANGYFKDENLTVTYKKFTSGRDCVNSVLGGESDVGVATEFPFANSILQGKDLRIIGTLYRTNDNAAVVARRDRGIGKAADLVGKRIGLAPNTNSDYMLSVILREAGIADDAVTRVALQPEQMADALEKGQVDAVATWAPHIVNAQARFAKDATIVLSTPAYTELSMLGARAQTIAKRKEALQRLVNALVRAEDFANAHSAEALQLVIDHMAVKQDAALRQDWPKLKFQVRLDNLLLTALANEGEWLARRARPSPAVPDYRATFAPEFLESARTQSVTVAKAGGG